MTDTTAAVKQSRSEDNKADSTETETAADLVSSSSAACVKYSKVNAVFSDKLIELNKLVSRSDDYWMLSCA